MARRAEKNDGLKVTLRGKGGTADPALPQLSWKLRPKADF